MNLILNKPIIKELIQSELNVKNLTKGLINLKNEKINDQIKLEYSNLHSICSGKKYLKKLQFIC